LMISAFGLAHVLYELRYCDERFGARTPAAALWIIGGLLAVIALARIGNGTHLIPAGVFVPIELSCGAALALTAAYFMRENRVLGAGLGFAFGLGAAFAPLETFLIWAWVHNLTPMGFVAEIMEGEERRRWLLLLSVPFFVLPALVATGVFHHLAALVFANDALWTASMFGAGDSPLLSFLPRGSSNLTLFSAAVVAQSMHYVAVIVLLPRLLAAKNGVPRATIVPWPSWPVFAGGVAAMATLGFGIYAVSYTDARAAYAVAAGIHAWVEVPILLLALGQGFTLVRR
ncbi:MAG: hypothetical protein K8S25_14555, partial [Alphaproteobacteria bacterium]|nr:hypothetical protein [Alphaproteobacteria bacterium]